jgi:hypothetical protein
VAIGVNVSIHYPNYKRLHVKFTEAKVLTKEPLSIDKKYLIALPQSTIKKHLLQEEVFFIF